MNAPVVAWQRGDIRIVAVEEMLDEKSEQSLIVEVRIEDAMGGACWVPADPHDESGYEITMLAAEIVSRNELLPKWVRDLVKSELTVLDDQNS